MVECLDKYDDNDYNDIIEFLKFLSAFVPQQSIDGAKYVIDEWITWADSIEYKDQALEIWSVIDQICRDIFNNSRPDVNRINELICISVPDVFKKFPIWNRDALRIAGKDIDPTELFKDPFTCILAWCGILGVHNGNVVPGYLLNDKGNYLYEGFLGSLSYFCHLFSNPAWRLLIVSQISKQYGLNFGNGKELLGNISSSQDDLHTLAYLLKKATGWAESTFNEQYICMPTADSFYSQCLCSYHPRLMEQHVFSTTPGAAIPVETYGGKIVKKHLARPDYFNFGLLGPGSENIKICYQWDFINAAIKLTEEQEKAEVEGRGLEHKREAIKILSRFLVRPNIELSEGQFSGIWSWKKSFTLVSERRVAFSSRDKKLKKINNGIWINHDQKPHLMNFINHFLSSNELTDEQKMFLSKNLPNATKINEKVNLLYDLEKKTVLKPYGYVEKNPLMLAEEIIESLLQRGKPLK